MSFSSRQEAGYLSFAKGLHTEISPLSTPEELMGTTSDELNMMTKTDGMVRVRRPGIDFVNEEFLLDSEAVFEDLEYWRDQGVYVALSRSEPVDGKIRVAIAIGKPAAGANPNINNKVYRIEVPESEYVKPSIAQFRTKLILTFGARPVLLSPVPGSDEYTIDYINLYIRDFRLIYDELTVSQRPSTSSISKQHRYNLLNAGWYQERKTKGHTTLRNPITEFYTVRGTYPSNADIARLGDVSNNNGDLEFSPLAYDNIDVGSSEAPRGHYIYDIRAIDRDKTLLYPYYDGAVASTLSLLVENGNIPGTTTPVDPSGPIDTGFPETSPGMEIP